LRAPANVSPLELGLTRVKAPQDSVGDVVPSVSASRIAAREKEQRRRVLDDDPPHVHGLGDRASATSLLDLQAERLQARDLDGQPRGFVFALLALGVAERRVALFPIVHVLWALDDESSAFQ
jgi:hypothetical protein